MICTTLRVVDVKYLGSYSMKGFQALFSRLARSSAVDPPERRETVPHPRHPLAVGSPRPSQTSRRTAPAGKPLLYQRIRDDAIVPISLWENPSVVSLRPAEGPSFADHSVVGIFICT